MRKATHNFEFERLCLHPVRCLKGQRWSTVAASVVSTGAIGPSVHPPDEAPAGLSLSSQRVRLMLITSTQRSVPRSCWVVFFPLSLPDRNLETSMRIHFHQTLETTNRARTCARALSTHLSQLVSLTFLQAQDSVLRHRVLAAITSPHQQRGTQAHPAAASSAWRDSEYHVAKSTGDGNVCGVVAAF